MASGELTVVLSIVVDVLAGVVADATELVDVTAVELIRQ